VLKRVFIALVRGYQRLLSPLKRGPSCRYLPTCSEYAIEAIRNRGAIEGSLWAVARVCRCNPLFHGGYHPAPCARHAQLETRPS
jgi:putative membrane protein insertion efficiency factor